jgi:biopolymer transport protein ExbD
MSPRHKSSRVELNASSMADIAFLLIIFFMVTTIFNEEKGLSLMLPPFQQHPVTQPVHDRNLYKIQINSTDQLLINGIPEMNLDGVREELKTFILNNGALTTLSESPLKAIVSLKADRGTSHKVFIWVLDEIQATYYEIYAERAGIPLDQYRELKLNDSKEKELYDRGREGIPMNISIAEPTHAGIE